MDEKLLRKIRIYALQNASKYNGIPNQGSIIGKVLGEHPELKSDMKNVSKEISNIINEVKKIPLEKQLEEIKDIPEEKHEEKERLKPLKVEKGQKVVMRFAPSPSGPLHLGHAYTLSLNSEYCRKYNGKMILRLEDTNSDNIYEPAYRMIPEDANWVTKNNIAEVIIQSDRMELYYKHIRTLFDKEKAYVCTCSQEAFKELVTQKTPCPCRDLDKNKNLNRFERMFAGYKEGEAVVRIKTDIQHNNPALRDWPAFRINDSKHPKVGLKYRVWPLMNFAVAIDDHELKVTHAIRAKDHIDNERKQEYLFKYMGWKAPIQLYVGRINFEDLDLSTTETKRLIGLGKFTGWDDIRLPFLQAMKKRGYQPDAFINYAVDVGVSQTDKSVTQKEFFKSLNHFNKEIIEKSSNRYFIVQDPKGIKIDGTFGGTVELDLHPDHERGKRIFEIDNDFYLEKEDVDRFEKKIIRLMDCLNFTKVNNKYKFHSLEYEEYKNKGEQIIHWLPKNEKNVKVKIIYPDGTIKEGLGEKDLANVSLGDVIQAERLGFMRLNKITEDNIYEFWYLHR